MSVLSEALGVQWAFLLNPYFYVLFFSPPVFLVGIYLIQRKCLKSRDFTWTVGICFVLSVLMLGIYIGTGWISSIRYVMYEDILLEKAIAQYKNPPQELLDYHYADGGRNTGALFFGGVYAMFIMLLWSPIILICWLIDRTLTRKKVKTKSCSAGLAPPLAL
jgi:hypothetical protein